ncbi:PiggyBac transposable element-derived protein 4 [Biomphalaria glabrata]|nr:piggyBac transposable element-derived protein 4 [Biomphalaria glabrata]
MKLSSSSSRPRPRVSRPIYYDEDSDMDPQLIFDDSDEDYEPPTRPRPQPTLVEKTAVSKGKGKCSRSTSLQSVDTSTTSSTSNSSDSADPEWDHITYGTTENNFRFHPLKMPGVCPDLLLSDQSSPLDFFHAIFDDRIKDNLIYSINSFARKKCQLNNPTRKRSVFGQWTDDTRSELDKFMAVLIKIGIEKKTGYFGLLDDGCRILCSLDSPRIQQRMLPRYLPHHASLWR